MAARLEMHAMAARLEMHAMAARLEMHAMAARLEMHAMAARMQRSEGHACNGCSRNGKARALPSDAMGLAGQLPWESRD